MTTALATLLLLLASGSAAVERGVPAARAPVEALRASLPFMGRVGPDIHAEIAALEAARRDVKRELTRLADARFELPEPERQAVEAHELVSPRDSASNFYQRKVSGLDSFIDVELRARKAALLLAELKPDLPADLPDAAAFRLIKRTAVHVDAAGLTPARLAALHAADALEGRQKELRRRRDEISREADQVGYALARAKGHLEPDRPEVRAETARLEKEHARLSEAAAPAVEALDRELEDVAARERALFEAELTGLFDSYNAMRSALLLPDEARGCCGRGCWNCTLTPSMYRNNTEEFFEGAAPLKPARAVSPPPSPAPDLALYRIRAALAPLLPYLAR